MRPARFAQAVPNLIRHLPQHRPWMIALSFITTVVVVATCGLGAYLLVRDERTIVSAPPTSPPPPTRDISNREVDPEPLTAADVFPDEEIVASPSIPPYQRIGSVQVLQDCRLGATADLGRLLRSLGCNQVVRATFSSPDKIYFVTAGIFNLKDEESATKVANEIPTLVDASKGRFTGYISTPGTRVLGRAPTHLAWEVAGHFLAYAVIARVDGKPLTNDEAYLKVMVYDIVEKYLLEQVIGRWALDPAAASPQPSTSASP